MIWYILVVGILLPQSLAHPGFFTSIGQMTDLIHTEKDLVTSLKDYIKAEEDKLEQIKKWAEKLDRLTSTATKDPEGFVGHPVNAFKLMKRLNTEWSELENLVLKDMSDGFISNLTIQRQYFPNDEDQVGAAKALLRLQDTYNLDTDTISKGDLPDPEHQRANGNLKYFEYIMAKEKDANKSSDDQSDQKTTLKKKGAAVDYLPERQKYEMLCRGEGIKMTPRRQKKLFCRYHDGNRNPKFILAPAKQEDEWDKPRIIRFHDIISDAEIEIVKDLAKPRLSRATVHDPETGKLTTAQYRVSKSAWLSGYENPVVSRINMRIQDLTGLDVSTAEELQVANYGVGGQYEPHFDFARKDEPDAFKELGTGNRIATWLFYMSDVLAGGATVFPEVGASVWPKKGTAVFWYNLFASGEGDYSTRHAACPVLVGNKWVSNKWLHERGQEFRRPCTLSELE
ncbi:prolyl 4-hydroxylase subunit alpha-1 isoform X3 [Cervus elaphus]|uniref:prolyl 4-hydroxylase subunit alpha-1 isoform X3 n=1 Tax=Cervus canadensis TaxID=1574408 RepID=UPI001C9E68B8|nr:prolyl 4-hydroxylase subunit alpha-1 isoform X3 [Cervus canadensis]XP_043780957.1 prolyl 4-hydroxylase subunit alpha-1 isoform X3 [Cervus elaphus]